MSHRIVCAGLLIAACTLLGRPVAEADAPGSGGPEGGARIPVRIVAGKLVVSCDLSTRFRRIPGNLFVEYENPCGLQLHNQAAGGIRAENRDGSTNEITIHLPDLNVKVAAREHGPEKVYEDFTKFHSPALGETTLFGTIGMEILKRYHMELDLKAGFMTLSPPAAQSEDAMEEVEGSTTLPVTLTNDLVWLPVLYEDGEPGAMALGTATYDTVVDRDMCLERGRPTGEIGELTFGDFDLSQYVAFRPEEMAYAHKDGVVGVTGLNLLKHFRVEIDRVNRVIRFTETSPAKFPEDDLAFFRARATEDAEPLEVFLTKYPEVRLSREAAHLLIDLRLDDGSGAETFTRAVKWVNDTHEKDLRATAMLELMEKLREAGQPDLATIAGKLGIESGRDDRYPDAVHKIHSGLGAIFLKAGNGKEAFRHLLSASFGMNEDGMVNLNLGKYYESQHRYKRAYSRYVQAVIVPESGQEALEGLKRLQQHLHGEERFSVDLVERMIGGKVLSFGAATKFKPTEKNSSNRVVLAEFFTNAHFRFAIGGALGNEGILSHFPRENVAVLCYHLPAPQIDPLVNELATYTARERNAPGPYVHCINGTIQGPGAARAHQKERLYNVVRRMILSELPKKSAYTLDVDAKVEGDKISGSVTVRGYAWTGHTVHIILAERGVLFPGKSKVVIHRMLARGALTDSLDGVHYQPVDEKMTIDFSRSLEEIAKKNDRYLTDLEKQGAGAVQRMSIEIDPHQTTIVAYIKSWMGEVLQAVQVDPEVVTEDPKKGKQGK